MNKKQVQKQSPALVAIATIIIYMVLYFVLAPAVASVKGQTVDQDRQRVIELIAQIDSVLAPAERDLRDQWRALYDSLVVVEQNASEAMRQRIVTRRVLASNQHQDMTNLRSQSNNLRRLFTELRDDLDITENDTELGLQILALQEQNAQLQAAIDGYDSEIAQLVTEREALQAQIEELEQAEPPAGGSVLLTDDMNYTPWVEKLHVRPIGWAVGTVTIADSSMPGRWDGIRIRTSTADLWGEGDYAMYAYTPTQYISATNATLFKFEQVDHRARTGIHLRESLEPGSRFLQIVYQSGRVCMSYRNGATIESQSTQPCIPDVVLPIAFEVYWDGGQIEATVSSIDTTGAGPRAVLGSFSLGFVLADEFYTGIVTTSWRTDQVAHGEWGTMSIVDYRTRPDEITE